MQDIDGRVKKLRETNAKEEGGIGGNARTWKLGRAGSLTNDVDPQVEALTSAKDDVNQEPNPASCCTVDRRERMLCLLFPGQSMGG